MGFESRAISAWVTKQIVTIFSKTCDNVFYFRHEIQIVTAQERRHVSNSQPNASSGIE